MSKIYRVKSTITEHTDRYVRANNRQSAVNFVARDALVANLATQDELVLAVTAGIKIEDISIPQIDDEHPQCTPFDGPPQFNLEATV